ncbi:MAG: hypothetical protein JRI25_20945 [Deltaproteobacteria bacterium]|nr:hypothetical protein [Deltaproteobacteria bacterium]
MRVSLAVRGVLIAVLGVAVAGCSCRNDTTFTPREQRVLENDHGQWLSMDVAPDGRLVVTYYDRSWGGIGFAKGTPKDSGEVFWDYEQVDGYPDDQGLNPGDRGLFTSVKVAPDGGVWASYYDNTNGSLRVAHRVGGRWETEVADVGGGLDPNAGQWTSLALDTSDNPVVAHYDAGKGELRVARRAESGWSGESVFQGLPWDGVDATGTAVHRDASVGMYARLLIDGSTEYIAFYDAAQQSLNLLEGFPGAYTHTVVYNQGNVGLWPSLWTDGTDLLIAFQAADTQDLMLARRSGGGPFSVSVVDDGEYRGADTEVFLRDGQLSILYFDGYNNDMRLATETGSGWQVDAIAGDGIAVGYHNEVAYTHDRWWVASYDYTNRRIFAKPL